MKSLVRRIQRLEERRRKRSRADLAKEIEKILNSGRDRVRLQSLQTQHCAATSEAAVPNEDRPAGDSYETGSALRAGK
jgi:hypothetical protein